MNDTLAITMGGFTATGYGPAMRSPQSARTYQASVKGTGAVAATVVIEGSNDGEFYVTLGTITLSGTTSASDGFLSQAAWVKVRAHVTAISGTGAACTVTMGA